MLGMTKSRKSLQRLRFRAQANGLPHTSRPRGVGTLCCSISGQRPGIMRDDLGLQAESLPHSRRTRWQLVPGSGRSVWSLKFGSSLEFGVWSLEFPAAYAYVIAAALLFSFAMPSLADEPTAGQLQFFE